MEFLGTLTIYHIVCIILALLVIIQWIILHRIYVNYRDYKKLVKIMKFLDINVNEKFTSLDESNKSIKDNPFYFTENNLIDDKLKNRKDLLIPLTVGKYKIRK